jgi:hypothetical protein
MRHNTLALGAAAALILATVFGGPGSAQSLDDQLRAQLRTVMGELNDLQNNQATLEAQKAAAEHERDALKSKLAAGGGRAARPVGASSAQLDQLKAENARLTQALTQAQADIAKYKDAYTHVVDSAQQVHAERDRFAQEATTSAQALGDCETKNITLVKVGRDVLSAYTKIGVTDALERGEPFIGLKRVKMERIAQDYGDKVYEAKFDPREVKRTAPASEKPAPAAAAAPPSTLPSDTPPIPPAPASTTP